MFLGFLIVLQLTVSPHPDTLRVSNEELSPTASNVLARVLTVISSQYSFLKMDTMDTKTGLTVGFRESIPDSAFVEISSISYYVIAIDGKTPDSLVSEKIGFLISDWLTPALARYFNKVAAQSWDQLISALSSGQIEYIVVSNLAEIPKTDKSLYVTKLTNFSGVYGLRAGLNDRPKLDSIVSQYRKVDSSVLSRTNSLAEKASISDRNQLIRYSLYGLYVIIATLVLYMILKMRLWTYGEVLISGHVLVRSKAISSDAMDVEKLRNKMIQIRDGMEELVSTFPFLRLQHDSTQTMVKLEISGKSYLSDAGSVISIMQEALDKSVASFISEDDMLYCDLSIRVNVRKYSGTSKYELYNSGGGLKLKNVLI